VQRRSKVGIRRRRRQALDQEAQGTRRPVLAQPRWPSWAGKARRGPRRRHLAALRAQGGPGGRQSRVAQPAGRWRLASSASSARRPAGQRKERAAQVGAAQASLHVRGSSQQAGGVSKQASSTVSISHAFNFLL